MTELRDWVPSTRTLTIGGDAVDARGEQWDVVNPATEAVLATVTGASADQVDAAVAAARRAFPAWAALSGAERSRAIHRLADVLEANFDKLVGSIVNEVGTPVSLTEYLQVRLGFTHLRWQAEAANRERIDHLGSFDDPVPTMSDVVYRPVGVVAAITGYNYPLNLAIFKYGAALAAGCTVVLLPSPRTPLTTLFLGDLIREADLPPGVLNVIIGGADVGQRLSSHPGVDKVSFTGSTAAGREVALACATGLRQVSLELGGKSAAIVLDDADPASAAKAIQMSSLANSGQVCNALSRVLIPRGRDDFVDALAAALDGLVVGDPSDPATQIGPLVAQRQQLRVRDYIAGGLADGARLVTGGSELPDGIDRGWYVRPTLFTDADNGMKIAREEIFGPVLTVIPYRDEDEAIRIANDSDYGLAGAVFTDDPDRGYGVAARVRAGSFGVNEGYIMDPLAPYGGMKASGYGRELGREGLESYLMSQSISCARSNS
jgi:aldehyde dehydrogenase (NAD+)